MSADADVQRRDRDMAGFRGLLLGAPGASTDVTRVGAAVAPPVITGPSSAAGLLFEAARKDHTHGLVLSGDGLDYFGGGIRNTFERGGMTFSDKAGGLSVAGAETLIAEWALDFDSLQFPFAGSTNSITCILSAINRASATAGTNAVRVRTGGTIGAADGTVRATLTFANALITSVGRNSGTFTFNTAGFVTIKITTQHSAPLGISDAYGLSAYLYGEP